ncbi:hypothetical protein DL93DRAFT_2087233 [Clavulina sp. PMI_390]|nr:hypothetical protein DL93DRAFT_2087233 [Clavulina sp. PMI_390]
MANERLAPQSRPLSANELSYFLPSREFGMNDAFLNNTFHAPRGLITPKRVRLAWAITCIRHPLMVTRVDMVAGQYDTAHFVYDPPPNPQSAIHQTASSLHFYSNANTEDLIERYTNGPRQIAAAVPTVLLIGSFEPDDAFAEASCGKSDIPQATSSQTKNKHPNHDKMQAYSMLIGVAHVAMDGVGTHMSAKVILELLGGTSPQTGRVRTDDELMKILEHEWTLRFSGQGPQIRVLPLSVEERAPGYDTEQARRDFVQDQKSYVGGHAIPRLPPPRPSSTPATPPGPSPPRRTIYQDTFFTKSDTTAILAKCKSEGVSIQNVLFAASNLSWLRIVHADDARGKRIRGQMSDMSRQPGKMLSGRLDWPALMYSAAGLRNLLPGGPAIMGTDGVTLIPQSHAYLSIGYYNVMLSSTGAPLRSGAQSASGARWFWDQAREARKQNEKAVKDPKFLERGVEHGKERCGRAKAFAVDDDKRMGIAPANPISAKPPAPAPIPAPAAPATNPPSPPPPSMALVGFSLLGNLDPIYDAARNFPALELVAATNGTRKGPGALLIFSHTCAGRLLVHVGWDEAGFEKGLVEDYAAGISECIREFGLAGEEGKDVVLARL